MDEMIGTQDMKEVLEKIDVLQRDLSSAFRRPVMVHFEFLDAQKVNVSLILTIIADVTGVPTIDLKSNKRPRDLAFARFYAYKALKAHLNYSLKEVGRLFDKDHSTILYGLRQFDDLYQVDKVFKRKFDLIETKILEHANY